MDNEKQACKNCKFFIQHYVKRKTYLQRVNCGHCILRHNLSAKDLKKFPFAEGCDKWEQGEPEVNPTDVEILKRLNGLYYRLSNLIIILSNNEK